MAVLLACPAGVAHANVIELQFTGVFNTQASDPNSLDAFAPLEGESFTLDFSFDTSTPDRNPDTNIGDYLFPVPPNTFQLRGGGHTPFTVTEREHAEMLEMAQPGGEPTITISADDLASADLALPPGVTGFSFRLTGELLPFDLADFDFGNTATNPLPDTPDFLLNAPLNTLAAELTLTAPTGTESLGGTITGITLVPEPTSLALLGLGGLIVARRRR